MFHTGATAFGLASAVFALGALGGALLAARRCRPGAAAAGDRRVRVRPAGDGHRPDAGSSGPSSCLLVPTGLALLTFTTAANSATQLGTGPEMRGRVMGAVHAGLPGRGAARLPAGRLGRRAVRPADEPDLGGWSRPSRPSWPGSCCHASPGRHAGRAAGPGPVPRRRPPVAAAQPRSRPASRRLSGGHAAEASAGAGGMLPMGRMRLFVAIALPPRRRRTRTRRWRRCAAVARACAGPASDAWHLTLAFLGEVDERSPPAGAAAGAAGGPAPSAPAGAGRRGAFPSAARARVLWCGVSGDRANSPAWPLRWPLPRAGPGQARPTRARASNRTSRWPAAASRPTPAPSSRALSGYQGPSWTAGRLHLIHSRLGQQPRYATVGSWAIGGGQVGRQADKLSR